MAGNLKFKRENMVKKLLNARPGLKAMTTERNR